MAARTAAGSLTAVGREQPVASVLAPAASALLALPPLGAARRAWRWLLAACLACSLLSKGRERLQHYRYAQYLKLQKQLGKHRPEPTWREILGRQGSHVVAGHVELALVAATSLVGVLVGLYREFLQGQFYVAQNSTDRQQWRRLVWLFPATTMVSALMTQITETCKAWVVLSWRRAVTYKIHELYFERRAYYHVLNQQAGLGVPDADSRICSDVREACDAYAAVMSGAVQTAVSILLQYASITSRIAWIDRGWVMVPPFFVLCVIPGVLGAIDYGRLWPIYGEMQYCGGAYSQALTRVQLHGERICMLHGEKFEYEVLTYHLNALLASFRKMLDATFVKDIVESVLFSGLFPSGFQALATFTSAGIVATEVLLAGSPGVGDSALGLQTPRGDVMARFGGYIRNWWGVVAAAGTLSAFMNTWSSLMEGQAAVQRVSSLFASMQEVRDNLPEAKPGAFQDRGVVIAFEDVTVATPSGQKLLEKLSFEVRHGDRLLICGHNGAGKSSIIRCLSALWPVAEGVIARPGGDGLARDEEADENERSSQLYYLPQKPCSVIGSLSDQLTYPVRLPGGLAETELRAWLRCVDLEHLVERGREAGAEGDWEKLLSLGELQALAIARLLYHHPHFAILDECTSAVSPQLERRLFALARALGVTCVTITHRPALQDLHQRMLRLTGRLAHDGRGWELSEIPHSEPLPPVAARAATREEALRRAQDLLPPPASGPQAGAGAAPQAEARSGALAPAEEAKRRWPSSAERFLALARLGLEDPGRRRRMAARLVVLLLGMRLHCDLLWQIWSCQMGAVAAALVGDPSGIMAEALSYLALAPAISAVDTWVKYQGRRLSSDLAEGLGQRLLSLAFSGGGLLGVMRPGGAARVENPMQRISQLGQHLEGMSSTLIELLFRISHGLYTLRTLVRGVGPVAFLSPPTYFAVFRLCLLVAPDFGFLSRREADLEARFQVAHTRLRHFAEPVAFSGGGRSERKTIEPHHDAVLDFKLGALRKKFLYRFIESLFSNHSYIPLYMQRLMSEQFSRRNVAFSPSGLSPEVVVQGFMFERSIMYNETMTHRLGSFTPTWREWDGTHSRILELVVALEAAAAADRPALVGGPEGAGIEVRGLDLVVPGGGRRLARGLTFDVCAGAPVVVSGPEASGKSLLASVLLGLAPACSGAAAPVRMPGLEEGVSRPPLQLLMPAPQRIYLPPGTLGDQVCYPTRYYPWAEVAEAAMQRALEAAGIAYLREREAKGWLHECRWEDVLSGGEQQRMGLARVLYQKPRFALLDECTSMVAHDDEESLYRTLAHDFGITPITLSQRLFLPDVHAWELKLGTGSEEGWSLRSLRGESGGSSPSMEAPRNTEKCAAAA